MKCWINDYQGALEDLTRADRIKPNDTFTLRYGRVVNMRAVYVCFCFTFHVACIRLPQSLGHGLMVV